MGICQFSHQKDMPVVALLHNNFLINMLKADYTEFIEQKLDLMSTVLFFFPSQGTTEVCRYCNSSKSSIKLRLLKSSALGQSA